MTSQWERDRTVFGMPAWAARNLFQLGVLFASVQVADTALGVESSAPPIIYVEGVDRHIGAYVFYVFWPESASADGQESRRWFRVDTAIPMEPGETGIRISIPGNQVIGKAGLLAVPREIAEGSPKGEAAWFQGERPGVVRVRGSLSVFLFPPPGPRVLRYRLEKAEEGFVLNLLNPEELARGQEGASKPVQSVGPSAGETGLWLSLLGAALLLVAVGALVAWKRRADPGQER